MEIYKIESIKKTRNSIPDEYYGFEFFLRDKGLTFDKISEITGKPKSTIVKKYNEKHKKENPKQKNNRGTNKITTQKIKEYYDEYKALIKKKENNYL